MWRKLIIVCLFDLLAFECAQAVDSEPAPLPAMHSEQILPQTDSTLAVHARRTALVIGNEDYPANPLGNSARDARAMSATLKALGFDVLLYENLTGQQMEEAVTEFDRRLHQGGVGLFYFAGHGYQVAGKTLLAPVDADSQNPVSLLAKGVDLQFVLERMSAPRPGEVNLVILDSCLTNPFQPGGVDHAGSADRFEQTLIAYAAAPGSPAFEGTRHGLYTAALLEAMAVPGRDIGLVLQLARAAVSEASGLRQIPWKTSTLAGGFRFREAADDDAALPAFASSHTAAADATEMRSRGVLPKDGAEQYELSFWESIRDSTHASDYEAYLQAYPKGRFAGLARARIERLKASAPTPASPSEQARPTVKPPAIKATPEQARPAQPAAKPAPAQARPQAPAARPVPEQAQPAQDIPAPSARPSGGPASVSEVKDCPTCPALIALPRGAYVMGSNSSDPSEKPAHQVSLGNAFAIGKYEVTVEQWNACADAAECPRLAGSATKPKAPVRDVSWDDARVYMKWLSKLSGKTYRLPTEAEWEYAARGGTTSRYWWGEQMRPGNANCKDCGQPWQQDEPVNVGSFAPNPYGLHDMNGSVWEWVSDCWHNSYKGAPSNSRAWDEPNCRVRVIRGGSWREGADYMPVSTRFKYDASVRHTQNGFRVARDAE